MSRRAWAAALLGLAAGGCLQTHYNLASHQQDYTVTSTEREVAMGHRIARRVEEELPPVADEPLQARLRGIGERLAAVSDRRELVYRFTAVDGDDINAFALPGGFVFVFRGLVEAAASDDELAGVIAHEVAHIAARHSIKRYEGGLGAQIAALAVLASREAQAARGLGVALQASRLAYARHDELEADRLGVKYLRAAGFDPQGMLTFLERQQEEDRDHVRAMPRALIRPQYARSHPFVPERISAVKEELFGVADYLDYLNTPR